jgi:hypothetical protein
MFQILGLLLTSDNGSTAKYIETHELVCVRISLFFVPSAYFSGAYLLCFLSFSK